MADKSIKHFIFMRFFPRQDPKYPYDIFDVDFLSKQVQLAKNNALSSLENQTNKNFELVFLANAKYFDDPKYDFIFSTLKAATTLPLKFVKNNDMSRLVKAAFNEYDFVIQSRMDFDDFIFKDAITDTHSKVNGCDNILAYGYCNGYEYVHGDLYVYDLKWSGIGHHSILQSLILKSSFAKPLPHIGIYLFMHDQFKPKYKEVIEKNGLEFSENMFQQNLSTKAYIYFRHQFSHYILTHNEGKPIIKIPNRRKITDKDITKKQLKEEFGFHLPLNSIKDEEADFDYDFTSTKAE